MVLERPYPISPPYTSTRHSKPMHTPNTGTLPVKYRMASRDSPESDLGCPGPGDIMRFLILS